MLSEGQKKMLRATANFIFGYCRNGVENIRICADVEDDTPYVSVVVWGKNDQIIYEWSDFPKKEGEL
jgi:uncharacterized membrane protein